MHTYKQLDSMLQGRNKDSRKVDRNTYMQRRGDAIAIMLHNTDIVTFHANGTVELDTGGWPTRTTRERMENWAPVRIGGGLGYDWDEKYGRRWGRTESKPVEWHITTSNYQRGGPSIPFFDGMVLKPVKGKNDEWQVINPPHNKSNKSLWRIRTRTDAEREQNYMNRAASFTSVAPGVRHARSGTYGSKHILEARKEGKTWSLNQIITDDEGVTVTSLIEGAAKLDDLRSPAYRWQAWESAEWQIDYDLKEGRNLDRTQIAWYERI